MSGGEYEYIHTRITDVAERIDQSLLSTKCQEHITRSEIVQFLKATAKAMRMLEWYDSGDIGDFKKVVQVFKEIPHVRSDEQYPFPVPGKDSKG